MNIIKLSECDYKTSKWSGGLTSQITIYPNDADVTNKDFIYRVSSATVTSDSKFTNYDNYTRFILTLDKTITLNDNIMLEPFKVHKFLGSDDTSSKGECKDFNLICRSDKDSTLTVIEDSFDMELSKDVHYILYSNSLCEIKINDKTFYLTHKESLVISDADLALKCIFDIGNVILCSIKI